MKTEEARKMLEGMNPFFVRKISVYPVTDFEVLNVINFVMRSGCETPGIYRDEGIEREVAGVKIGDMEYLYYVNNEEEASVFPEIDLAPNGLIVCWYTMRKANLSGLTELDESEISRLEEFKVPTSQGVIPFSAEIPDYYDHRVHQLFFCVTSKEDKNYYFEFSNYTNMVRVMEMIKKFNAKEYKWFILAKEEG